MHISRTQHIGSIGNLAMPLNITSVKIIFCDQCSVKELLHDRNPLHWFLKCFFRLGRNIVEGIICGEANIGKPLFVINISLSLLHFRMPVDIQVVLRKQLVGTRGGQIPVQQVASGTDNILMLDGKSGWRR